MYKGLKISISYPFPIANSFSVELVKELTNSYKFKLNSTQLWIELEQKELINIIAKSSQQLEIYYYGLPHILVTRAYLNANKVIRDKNGETFVIKKDLKLGLCYLYPSKTFKSEEICGVNMFYDLTNTKLNEDNCSSFNLYRSFY